ncbi:MULTISPECIES: FecCD family ABC transporter permease [unclassified Halomonas]|uniref:FecCD family ABC transporter permease n=1 Tax=unclassified Halomonas TaxID=2609666 RepID=UPI0018FEF43B|nr:MULTISPECIES: iron ABC transporter permease [unclassified Halomonas]
MPGMANVDASLRATIQHQRRLERRRWRIIGGIGLVAFLTLVLDIATGPSMLAPKAVMGALLNIGDVDEMTRIIVMEMRLPMALMALVVGAALGVGGAEIQTLLNNPMASPYTLGLAAAAGFGASLVIALGTFGLPLLFAVPLGAFIMTMLASGVLFAVASLPRMTSAMLVLTGIALLFLFQSLLSLVQYLSAPEVSQQILFWLFGNLTKTNWLSLSITAVVAVVCISSLMRLSWQLTALRLGEQRAAALGVDPQRLRLVVLFLVALMTSVSISFVGVIGFIGLVAPHVARMLVGEDQRFFVPLSMVTGAAFLSASSVLSKSIIPGALFPVGIVTAFIGVPFFFWIIISRR